MTSSCPSQVKAVYIKNLPKYMTQDQLRELFGQHGKITKVVIPPAKAGQENCRFGFVHFAERSSAMKALKNTEKYEIDGNSGSLYFAFVTINITSYDEAALWMILVGPFFFFIGRSHFRVFSCETTGR